jgi:hypothetical protein
MHIAMYRNVSLRSDSYRGARSSLNDLIPDPAQHQLAFPNSDGSEIDPASIGIDRYSGAPAAHNQQGTKPGLPSMSG